MYILHISFFCFIVYTIGKKTIVFYNMRSVRHSLYGRRQIDGNTLVVSALNNESRKYACCSAFLSRQLEEAVETRLFFIQGRNMVENGLYVVRRELLEIINSLGGDCDISNGNKRPVFCCLKDNKIDGLYWAIPTSDLSHRKDGQKEYYEFCLECPDNDLRSCYYHIAKTTKDALYKISSCYPVTEKYIDHPFVTNNVHVVMKKQDDIDEIRRKFKRILSMEFRKKNYFPQHITDIKNYLVEEINGDKAKKVG